MDPSSTENEIILNEFWERGMRKGTEELVREAASRLKWTTAAVKKWAANKKRRVQRAQQKKEGKKVQRKKNPPLRKKRGFDLFVADFLKKRGLHGQGDRSHRMKEANLAWKTLPKEDKKEWNLKAETTNEKVVPVKADASQLRKLCRQLWDSGIMVSAFVPREGDVELFCPPAANYFWAKSQAVLHEYGQIWNGKNIQRSNSHSLRVEIQDLFNDRYQKAVGNLHERCNYSLIDSGELRAIGLPEGITLKRPGSYVVSEKQAILTAKDDLVFEGQQSIPSTSEVSSSQGRASCEVDKGTDNDCSTKDIVSNMGGGEEDQEQITVDDASVPVPGEDLILQGNTAAPVEHGSHVEANELDVVAVFTVDENCFLVPAETSIGRSDSEVELHDAPTATEQLATAQKIAEDHVNKGLSENLGIYQKKKRKRILEGEGTENGEKKRKAKKKQPLNTLKNFWSVK